jgi:Arc/MetJ family transcription regulator
MKMTMHIDAGLLERVRREYDFSSKTETVDAALRELDRRARFRELLKRGLGASPAELKGAVDPDYDIHSLRVAEGAGPYGRK